MGARLPPVPPSLLQEGYSEHRLQLPPLPPVPAGIISPKPQVPPVSSARTTKALEYQASVVLKQQQQQQHQQPPETTANMSMANARVANWVASTPVGQAPPNRTGTPYMGPPPRQQHQVQQQQYIPPQPYQQYSSSPSHQQSMPPAAGYRNPAAGPSSSSSSRPPIPNTHQQQGYAGGPPQLNVNTYDNQQQQPASPSYYPASPSMPSMHPPRASSMAGPSTQNGGGGNNNYPSYDPQRDRRALHHSFSELTLGTNGNNNSYLAVNNNPSNLGTSTSRLNPSNNDPRYRTTSMVGPTPPGPQSLDAPTPRPLSASTNGRPTPTPRPMSDPNASIASMGGTSSSISSTNAALCIALPSQADLAQQREAAQYAPNPAAAKVSWAKAVLKFVERHQASSSQGEFSKITDPTLVKWTDEAIRLILTTADNSMSTSTGNNGNFPVPEALYLRGELSSSGKFPSYRSKDLSMAFRDFETAANLGWHAAWAKIALAYETYGEQNNSQADFDRARRAYEEGVAKNERMAMAHLLGQLGCPANAAAAIPLLRKAASLSTVDDPLPAYIFGMLLAGELDLGGNVTSSITPNLLLDEFGRTQEARPWIERSAYLGYAAAQFKMGFNYEYATMGCEYDPLLSVQYYSLASQQGDIEADMALSKWFLCGSEAFDLQENLAFTFAEKAAKKGLPSAEFAIGYYYEIGIGGRKDIDLSIKWYTKAAAHGNTDAADRLSSLESSSGNVLSRTEHEAQMNDKIVRRRTQAKLDADTRRRKNDLPPSLPDLPPMPAIPSHLSQSTGPGARPPRVSSVEPVAAPYYPNPSVDQMPMPMHVPPASVPSYAQAPMPQPPILPTTDSNMSLRRRDTMRQVEQAAAHNRNSQGRISQTGSATPPRKDAALAPPSALGPAHIRRYSLVDDGPKPPTTSSGSSQSSHSSAGVQIVNKPQTGPQTFEAMGLKTGKVKADQECVIC